MSTNAGTLSQQIIVPRDLEQLKRKNLWRLIPATLVFCALVTELWVRIEILHVSYQLEQARTMALKNDAQLRELKFQLASVTSPSTIAEAMKARGFAVVSPQRVRRLERDT